MLEEIVTNRRLIFAKRLNLIFEFFEFMPERISVSAHLMLFEGQVKKRVAFEFFLWLGHSFLDFFNLAV
jgi:hypothetical protein